ncbi:30S ribosomal protein S12 methylthiotransferase RimO [Prochlorococcus sp. MIT 1341]|uniref:30S ribosomal protein S12 methylthiotransferase RimO n=1 Tax=Prochlorococcus sp. MIT 1341 TaxID=3096221 RepID=UPI002A7667D0|nr:30S ribosomal protein S12 methylthiotransferase RimO [Prochlorococcus sp. MIT 1341]
MTRHPQKNPQKPSVAFAHLGCEKNRVDTEHMLGLLNKAGYRVTEEDSDASVVVVNTCSFIQEAREESVKKLVDLADQGKELIIAGCLAQHFREDLLRSLPEAKAIVGTGDYQHIVEVLKKVENGEKVTQVTENPTFVGDENLPRLRTTSKSVAYIKIAEGCDYRCSFCIIPKLRGNKRSRPIQSIVNEAKELAKNGVKELILISQISTNYGIDLYGKPKLAELLRELGSVNIPWIRVHYAYPTGLTKKVLEAYHEVPNVLPYLDLPLQHSHPEVLKAMNRPWQTNINEFLLDQIRDQLPNAILRTTLIVGFPGETSTHFDHLVSFIKNQKFDHIGVFTFSKEEGTPSATMPNQIPKEISNARKDHLMSIQQPIAAELNSRWIGKTVDVLIEQINPQTGDLTGRCSRFAPEVDGNVHVKALKDSKEASLGMMVPVLITDSDIYDLSGEIIET